MRVGLALVPLELTRPILVVVRLVHVRLGYLAVECVVVEGHDLEVVLERGELLVHHKGDLVERAALADGQDLVQPSRRLVQVAEEQLVHVVAHVHHARVEGVHIGAGGDAERARHARDVQPPRELAPLPIKRGRLGRSGVLAALGGRRRKRFRMNDPLQMARQCLFHESDESVGRAVSQIVLVRMRLPMPVDADGGERVDVVPLAGRLRRSRRAIDPAHAHPSRVRLVLEQLPGLTPHRLEAL
mmetsp:Transcript_54446/g.125456  ORF Transcript_54446/g.125456 Transcript_54446/m.125456 type:complete len:243 (+) Transcript_54446:487-1215(+)